MKRSYYSNNIHAYLNEDEEKILGNLSINHAFALESAQKNAWKKQIQILKKSLKDFSNGKLYFEFAIPRMGKRVDNIIVIDDLILVLEFKVGEVFFLKHAIEQVVDYCLDLKNFHEGSHDKKIIPILIATKAKADHLEPVFDGDISSVMLANEESLTNIIKYLITNYSEGLIDISKWENSIYRPTPTIIEAAQGLYKQHSVEEITRNDAGAVNLIKSSTAINEIIEYSKKDKRKSICFLTGVPGAGKTLAGLNIANERMKADNNEHAVFLSGNGPLVYVLREALTRDDIKTAKERGINTTKKTVASKTHAFIQNIHHFRDDNLNLIEPPIEKVVVFDEAQRAWQKDQVSSFMKRKKGVDDFNMSEPEYLISVMDRHKDWCVIICLIGGGQEINTGEAGVAEWISSLKSCFSHWDIYYSNQLLELDTYLQNTELASWLSLKGVNVDGLHLSTSVRSFRSENVSHLVHKVIEGDYKSVHKIYSTVQNNFSILVTRNLNTAKLWLKNKSKGSERYGLIASSGGKRLRPTGIDVNNSIDAPNWFLNPSNDVRSSNHLEDIATEFDIQGLEIDWACLAWDINFYPSNEKWICRKFKGTKWQMINSETDKQFLKNTYRVLLTRARQGLIIFVPEGDSTDNTRPPQLYDNIYNFLVSCGFQSV
ncbi:MAG: hypothetical protein RIR12_2139 [Bacteroidota bacterium]|jgi:hypothetical protein